MPLARLLRRERVEIVDAPLDREALIARIAALLVRPPMEGAPAAPLLEDRLLQRERLASTALGHGVAIPHARVADIAEPRAAFLRLEDPVELGAQDGRPVDLVLAMVVPEQAVAGHLGHLAEIAERFSDEAFRAALRAAVDADALARLLLEDAA